MVLAMSRFVKSLSIDLMKGNSENSYNLFYTKEIPDYRLAN